MTAQPRFRLPTVGVLVCALVATCVFVYFLSLSGVELIGGRSFTFRAIVPSAVTLATDADVREAGVQIGSVRRIATVGDNAMLTLSIDPRYGPVYRDAQVQVRAKTLVGENYVAITMGSPVAGRLQPDGLLPLADALPSTQLDQILSTFSAPRRRDFQRILDVLGRGLGGRGGELNALLEGSSDLIDNALPTTTVLAQDRRQLAGLIADFGTVAAAIGSQGQSLQTFVRAIRTEAEAVSSRNVQLRAVLSLLPGVLSESRAAVGDLGTFALQATPVMANLRVATEELVPAMKTLGPAAAAARRTVTALGRFAPVAETAAAELKRFAPHAVALLPALEGALRQTNPMFAYLAPYATTLGSLYGNLRAGTTPRSAKSYYGRLNNNADAASLAATLPPSDQSALQAILNTGLFSSVSGLKSNPYPAPGTLADPKPWSGTYPRLEPDPPYTTPPTAGRKEH